MAAEFSRAIELGVKLSKRIYYGRDRRLVMSAPPMPEEMTADAESYLPTAPMVYAEINDPAIVDNPDVPSYQPYVYGRCDPPALIPLHMHRVAVEVDCCLDTAFVTVSGAWRLHCVTASKSCSCRIAVPMGEQGSVLGVEVETPLKSFNTELISMEDGADAAKAASSKDGLLIKGHIYTLKVPRIDGGTVISIKFSWSQKLLYEDGRFCLNVPFTFPSYVNPMVKNITKKEKISVNVNSGTGTEVFFQSTSHHLKRTGHEAAKIGFSTEREVESWSREDFNFSYNVASNEVVGGVLLQSPSLHDYDQREMFCLYLYPGKLMNNKVFRRQVVFLVDISASMQGNPLDYVKTSLLSALSKLNPVEMFNIIAFNESSSLFSSSLVQSSKEMIEKASQWIEMNLTADGGTNISAPLNQAINMFSKDDGSLPIVFLITDGAVEDEKDICDAMRGRLAKGGLNTPRICTFGIGPFCNHYFLQMLAQIGRGYYEAAFGVGYINLRLERLISTASSVVVADINVDSLKDLDSLEICPAHTPDLSSGCPVLIWGRYSGSFPDNVDVDGTLADLGKFEITMKVQHAKDIPVDRVIARRQVNSLTAHAWLSGSKQLEEKATKLSLLTGVPSEYTSIVLSEIDRGKLGTKTEKTVDVEAKKMTFLRSLGIGCGNIEATAENRHPEEAEPKLYEASEMILKAASNFCARWCNCCCCMCFLQFCNKLNDQCAIAFTQLCTVLACFECINICCEICSGD
ncbi:inter-alpha-trypsin inhibitor heavy chain-like protein [Perilla frutescens var. frutescens]|nr:inter-alpha-trypsin inhibitor heavy chain-like protein [Perilla frutescens var. frutescens]